MGTFLKTDLYELTMLDAALQGLTAYRDCVFELFTRNLPPDRGWGVVAGVGRLVEAIGNFMPVGDDWEYLKYLERSGVISDAVRKYLYGFSFRGRIWAYREGTLFFPNSPVMRVEGTFAECVLIETLALSIMNHDSAIASAASRFRCAAGKALLVDMGSRRTDEDAAIHAARAAYVGGFDMTSNMAASRKYGIPVAGTHAHAWVLAHAKDGSYNEYEAYVNWFRKAGPKTTVLIDTYNTSAGLDLAIEAHDEVFGKDAIPEFRVRIDSGDPQEVMQLVHGKLNRDERTSNIGIVLTGDLTEDVIARIASRGRYLPTPTYGVGTNLVTGAGYPTCGFVYKLVEINGQPVSKTSWGKGYKGGRKVAYRLFDKETGDPIAERLFVGQIPEKFPDPISGTQLQKLFIDKGKVNYAESLESSHNRVNDQIVMFELHNRLKCHPLLIPTTEPIEYAVNRTV